MNESETLSAGQESLIVLSAVMLLKERIRGGTQNIIFDDPDAPYLASCPEKIQESDASELTTISIHEAIILSTKTLLKRTKQVDVLFSTATLQRIYNRVMFLLNEKLGPITSHPAETKEVTQKIEQMESDITMIIHYLEQIFDNYCQTDDPQEKSIYGRLIDAYLQMLIEKKASIQELPQIYSLPGDFYEGDFSEARPDFTSPSKGFLPVKTWTGNEDEGGGLEDLIGSELVIENIAFSEAESALLMFCPKDFIDIDEFFQENFSWSIVGAESTQEKSNNIEDHPHILEKKYRIILRRKQAIYFYITKILLNKIQKQGRNGHFMTAIIGLRSMTHFLPILKNEIDELMVKIKNISPISSEEEDTSDKRNPINRAEKELQDLTEKKTNALRNRDTYLSSFFYMPEASELLTPMLEMLHAQIAFFTKKIDDYSSQIYGPKNIDAHGSTQSLEGRIVVHIDRLYNDPLFFQKIPQTVEAPLTPVECELIEMCNIGEAVAHFEKVSGMTTKDNIYMTDETDEKNKMEWLLILFEMIISRKMYIYSQALPFTYEVDMDHPIHESLENLREETRVAEMSRNILIRRVNCEDDDTLRGPEIMTEIDELWNRRFHQLKYYFTQQENARSRSDITEALTNSIEALLERWQDRDNLELEDGDGEGMISLPEMSPEEEDLLQYVPEDIRENDPIFHDAISYHIYPHETPTEQRREKQHLLLTYLCERLLVIYFFAQSNIDIIDSEMAIGKHLVDKQADAIAQVREKIETSLEPLKKTILHHLAALGGYRKPKKIETPIHLYNKSNIIHAQLDGLRAHVDDSNKDTINECYEMIQKVVHRFSYEIYKNKTIGNNQARSIQLRHRKEIKKILIEITKKVREKLSGKEAESRIDFMKKIVKQIDRKLFSPKALIEDIYQQSITPSNTEED